MRTDEQRLRGFTPPEMHVHSDNPPGMSGLLHHRDRDAAERASMTAHRGAMTTLGVDLASQAKNTGFCAIEWEDGIARVSRVGLGLADKEFLTFAEQCDKVGIDAPFGWPQPFVNALNAHSHFEPWP